MADTPSTPKYDFTAIWAILVTASPEIINGLVELFHWLTSDPGAPAVPETWKPWIRAIGFALALWARSIVIRKPLVKTPDETPAP